MRAELGFLRSEPSCTRQSPSHLMISRIFQQCLATCFLFYSFDGLVELLHGLGQLVNTESMPIQAINCGRKLWVFDLRTTKRHAHGTYLIPRSIRCSRSCSSRVACATQGLTAHPLACCMVAGALASIGSGETGSSRLFEGTRHRRTSRASRNLSWSTQGCERHCFARHVAVRFSFSTVGKWRQRAYPYSLHRLQACSLDGQNRRVFVYVWMDLEEDGSASADPVERGFQAGLTCERCHGQGHVCWWFVGGSFFSFVVPAELCISRGH